ncbi:MAG: helix-hairpin-helix domain-containing protein [Lactococcus plantarum]|nr:helix-hairpin-helix domain-containing protein [Lactococcus plantarum]MDN6069817.1 helix-hairpin-helix domain-containing protein [Lactococcus plantarum]MDN6084339.1 helix-hairpin-helix domain-containing protein [Lactococcus plantarum]
MQLFKVIEKIKVHWRLVSGVLVVLSLGTIFFIKQESDKRTPPLVQPLDLMTSSANVTATKQAKAKAKEKPKTDLITVDLKGAVHHPAIYTLSKDKRVDDVIKLAGGLLDQADTNAINLAQKLADEMVIYVASVGEVIPNHPATAREEVTQSASPKDTDKVNLNTADLALLQKLSGVGMKKAQDIIDYREQNGNFKTIEELVNVSGFGTKSIDKLKESVTVD